jgi:hypothetical protein
MSSLSPVIGRPRIATLRSLIAGAALALVVAGCSASSPTFPPAPTGTSSASASDATVATATAGTTAGSSVAAATATPTPAATASPTTAPTATAAPTKAPATLPPLAVGLCTQAQLKLTIDYWVGDGSAGAYAHVHVTNTSSRSCNMRGTPQSRVVNAGNLIIVDSGAVSVSSADPIVPLAPGAKSYNILQWNNWCKADPSQNVKVAVVLPFGLGALLASANGPAPIPSCYSTGSKSTVSAEDWQL